MSQHSIAYQAARQRAAFLVRRNRGRIVVSGAQKLADNAPIAPQ